MPHRRTLEGLSRPGLRLQGWRRLPAGSKIAVVILALIAAMAILAPVVAPYDPGDTGLAKIEHTVHVEGIGTPSSPTPPSRPRPSTRSALTSPAATSSRAPSTAPASRSWWG